jgi:PadR family transcriptional regulator AphA
MSLRFALLALLSAKPMTGYDVMQYFEGSVGWLWHAPHTQMYPELRRLEADGFLEAEDVPRGPRGTKRSYALTDAGREELHRQASSVVPPQRARDPYRLRATYLEWADPESARAQLRAHIEHFQQQKEAWAWHAARLRAREVPLLRDRLENVAAQDQEAVVAFKAYAFDGLGERADMEIRWAERGLDLIDELEGAGWRGYGGSSTPEAPAAGGREQR